MPVDPSIYGMMQQPKPLPGPLDQYAQGLQVRNMMGQGQMQDMQLQQAQQAQQEQMQLRDLFRGGTPKPEQVMAVNPKLGMEFQKNALEAKKTQGDIDKTAAETLLKNSEILRNQLATVRDQQSYDAWRELGMRLMGPDMASKVPPQFTPELQAQMLRKADEFNVSMADQLRSDDTRRGQDISATTARRGQDITSASAEASRRTTERGQDLTDARAREAAERERKPTEPMLVAAGYASRMKNAEAILTPLEAKGVGRPEGLEVVAGRAPLIGGKEQANVARSPERQQYHQAQEDWVRAKLRKESGAVIADEEMDREIRTYFPQIGDSKAVKDQKRVARAVAATAMEQAAGSAPVAPPRAQGSAGALKFLGFE